MAAGLWGWEGVGAAEGVMADCGWESIGRGVCDVSGDVGVASPEAARMVPAGGIVVLLMRRA
jgi:hypothetical protein